MKTRVFLTAVVAGFLGAHAIATAPAAASLWTKVPPLPTTCYAEGDPAYARLVAAHDSIQQDHERQKEANAAVDQQSRSTDMMAVAGRMQQQMMSDPQAAARMIEAMSNPDAVAQGQAERTAQSAEDNKIRRDDTKALKARYDAALYNAEGPARARWDVLRKKLGLAPDANGPGEMGVPEWAWAEWHAILRMRDQAYEATCPAWFGAGGQVQAHLARYKDFLVQKRIPSGDEIAKQRVATYESLYNTSATSYKSLATHEAVEDYIGLAQELYQWRPQRPKCPDGKCTA
jgi:hypothetical protein